MPQVISQFDQIARLVSPLVSAGQSIVRNAANTGWEMVTPLVAAGRPGGQTIRGGTGTEPLTITGGGGATVSGHTQLVLRNTNEIPADGVNYLDDYQNEVHLRLQAGSTQDHRAYLNFANHLGEDNWLIGRNASNYWIHYDVVGGVHRSLMIPGSYTSLNAATTQPVRINYHTVDPAGTGGLEVWSGGGASQVRWHSLNTDGIYARKGALGIRLDENAQAILDVRSGVAGGPSQNQYLRFHDTGTARYYFGRHNSNDIVLYSLEQARYFLRVASGTGRMAIGLNTPLAQLHVQTVAATPGMIVQGAADQTANLQEWRNSGGTSLVSIDPSGAISVNGGLLYVEGGALKYRGSGGTVTELAPA